VAKKERELSLEPGRRKPKIKLMLMLTLARLSLRGRWRVSIPLALQPFPTIHLGIFKSPNIRSAKALHPEEVL
jgi:hypothetical protein